MTITVPQELVPRDGAAIAAATRVRWSYIAPTLLVYWIISMFDKSNISLVMADPKFLDEMQLVGQSKLLGWLAGSMFISYSLAAPLWGWAVTRYGPRNTIMASLAIWALTCFWSGLSHSYGMLLASRIGLGVGEAACYPVTLALVANWFALRERGKATSFWWIGTMIGPMLTGLVVTGLILAVGWRGQFYALGILALVLPLPMVWFLVGDKPEQHPAVNAAEADLVRAGAIEKNDDAPGRILRGVSSVWRNYRFWLMVLAISCNAIFFWGWSIWLPTYLRTARHFAFSTSGYLTFIIYGFAVVTILITGRVSDRVFRRAPFAGLGWASAAVLLMAAALAPSATWSVILMICALCAQQVGISCAEMLMHSVIGTADMGKSQGVRALVTQMTGALSPVMIGYILAFSGGGFIGAFAVLSCAVVISAGCMIALTTGRDFDMAVPDVVPPSMRVGDIDVWGLSDGILKTSLDLLIGMERAEADKLVGGTDDGSLYIPVNNFFIRRGEKIILIDAGAGNTMQPTLGKLPENLRAAGVEPSAVTHIVMTHLHPDHANGLVNDAGKPHYPNAEIVVHQTEADFWTQPDGANDSDQVKGNRARTAINLKPYLERIRRVRDGEEYLGFAPVLAPGHTPGHTCWLLAASGGGFLAFGDVVHLSAIQISHPDAALTYDLDKDLAIKSRKRILDMAATERLAIAGAHVNAPGFGYVVRKGLTYAFEPGD